MAIQEVRVKAIDSQFDVLGSKKMRQIEHAGGEPDLRSIRTAKVYLLEGISDGQADQFARNVLCNPQTEEYAINTAILDGNAPVLQIGYLEGLTDPQAGTIKRVAGYHGLDLAAVASAHEYALDGLNPQQAEDLASRHLYNPIIEKIIRNRSETLVASGELGPVQTIALRNCTREELKDISEKMGIYLDENEMLAMQKEFIRLNRDPTDAEILEIGGVWGDHCAHTTMKGWLVVDGVREEGLFQQIKKESRKHKQELVLSSFEDNSGVMDFYQGTAINIKGETHITPSAQDPINGAATGVGGLERDVDRTGQGGKVILLVDHYGVAPLDLPESDIPRGCLPPLTLLRGMVEGTRDYGNPTGVPTFHGSVHFHSQFKARPTDLIVGYGIMDKDKVKKGEPQPGDKAILVGGRTGRDGILGATFSSTEMHADTSKKHSLAVQIAGPIEQKKMMDALSECTSKGLVRAGTDLGALGIGAAFKELGEETGIRIDLAKVPLKSKGHGFTKAEILISESQEREGIAVAPENVEQFLEICRRHDVEATVIGEFTDNHQFVVNFGEEKLVDLSYDFLINGLPTKTLEAAWVPPVISEAEPPLPEEWQAVLEAVLLHGDICSKKPIQTQYDSGVQGRQVLAPFTGVDMATPNDAVVVTPILGEPFGLVASGAMNPVMSEIDPYDGSLWAAAQAMAKLVAVGGNPDEVNWVNNYISGKAHKDKQLMGAMRRCTHGVIRAMQVFDTPVTSGKDSFSSSYEGQHVQPYVCISAAGRIPDVDKTVTADLKRTGSILCVVGKMDENMGGSAYNIVRGLPLERVSQIDPVVTPKVIRIMHEAIKSGGVHSCKVMEEGGLLTTISQMCFGADCGAEINVPNSEMRADIFLFNITAGTFVVEVENEEEAEKLFKDVPYRILGKTTTERKLKVNLGEKELIDTPIDHLKKVWEKPMEEVFN